MPTLLANIKWSKQVVLCVTVMILNLLKNKHLLTKFNFSLAPTADSGGIYVDTTNNVLCTFIQYTSIIMQDTKGTLVKMFEALALVEILVW